jgi:AraC-like DNA-binding protein
VLLERNRPRDKAADSGRILRDNERIRRMMSYIEVHYREEVTVSAIADSAMISISECLRCFRSTIGTTPIQYLKQYRIQQAARLLKETPEKVSEIASRCGFQDMSYFTKVFREVFGCVPTEYRKNASP